MRALFGLAVPLLLLAVSFTTMVPQASAQVTTYTITGLVLSDEGTPLEGVHVSAYSYPEERIMADDGAVRNVDTTTDADGRYTLKLPEGKGYINVYYEKWRQSDGRELSLQGDQTIDFTLRTPPPKDAKIEGRVVDVNGRPIEGAEVSLQGRCCYAMPAVAESDANTSDSSGSGVSSVEPTRSAIMPDYYWDDYAVTTTDADGRFTFDAYAGPRQVYAWAKGYAQTYVPVDAVAGETTTVEVTLEKVPAADAIVTGRVINSETGAPVARAQVNLRSLEWGRYAWAETGSDGTFRLTTVPGWAELSVSYYDYGEPVPVDVAVDSVAKPMIVRPPTIQFYPYTTLVDLESGENDVDAPLDPKPKPTIALVGYVVDPETKTAVPDARVSVWNHETGDWGEAITDATGSFRILVRAGHYSGSAYKDGYLGGTQSFLVTGDATQRIDLLMPKGTTKWAPCYDGDDGCGGPIMYRDVAVSSGSAGAAEDTDEAKVATATGAPAPAPAVAPTAGGLAAAESSTQATNGGDTNRPASFSGEGGGLPPYDPAAADEIPASAREDAEVSQVPGLGIAGVALAMLGAAALVAARRRER